MKPKHKSEEIFRMSGYLWILYDYTQPHTLMLTSTGNEHDIYIKISACIIMANWYPWYACNGIDQLRWPIFCLHWATNIVQQSIQPAASTNMVKPSHMSIWQLYRSRTKRRRMKNCIPCQAICCLPLPCDRDEYASNTTPISVQLRTPSGPPTHIRTWLSIQWMPLPFTTIGN